MHPQQLDLHAVLRALVDGAGHVAELVEQPAVLRGGVEQLCSLGGICESCEKVGQGGLQDVERARDGDVVECGNGCAEVVDFV